MGNYILSIDTYGKDGKKPKPIKKKNEPKKK